MKKTEECQAQTEKKIYKKWFFTDLLESLAYVNAIRIATLTTDQHSRQQRELKCCHTSNNFLPVSLLPGSVFGQFRSPMESAGRVVIIFSQICGISKSNFWCVFVREITGFGDGDVSFF